MSEAIKELASKFHNLVINSKEVRSLRSARPVVQLNKDSYLAEDEYQQILTDIISDAPMCMLNEIEQIDEYAQHYAGQIGILIKKESGNLHSIKHKNVVITF